VLWGRASRRLLREAEELLKRLGVEKPERLAKLLVEAVGEPPV